MIGRARSAGAAGSTRMIGSAGATGRSARMIGSAGSTRRSAGMIGSAWSTRPTRAAGSARVTGCVRRMDTSGSRTTVVTGRTGRRRSRSGVGDAAPHAQHCGAQGTGDGYPPKYLLKFHSPSPV
ncbi:hypothetical protein A5750_01810 [Mycobacterium sp. 852002-51613_SCH5001154]|nr:hypothetical protein A5750_01810 [Mycobacterium sp. 852002-51613_SCH5001154]